MAKDEKAANPPSGIAEEAMEHARRAADTYCDFVKQAIAATPSGGNEFAERIKGYAEKNITMTQEYLRQLSQARTFQDMVRIQADFMQSLMKAFGEQSLGEAYKAAADMEKKPLPGIS
jgi:Phasin protein